ncbi:hypothetical protein B0H15DRAFT_943899 [Mycena belliarum]|uniref:Uncharacterized protein n=1 Tax=Mycena belliarum TaxID=1033014 RepID=A0AAD6UGR2_9AGAR|nr:hypothetical protein B0H15DRAFT_943899 [Mycena belliae]
MASPHALRDAVNRVASRSASSLSSATVPSSRCFASPKILPRAACAEAPVNTRGAVLARLATTVELASPAPLRARAASPRRRSIAPSSLHGPVPRTSRSRSPGRSIPAKRQRIEERKHQDHAREGFVIMGPLADSPLIPLQLFESLIATNLPAFALTKPYDAVVDPVHPYHIRVTLDSLRTARDLVDAWSIWTCGRDSMTRIHARPSKNQYRTRGIIGADVIPTTEGRVEASRPSQ